MTNPEGGTTPTYEQNTSPNPHSSTIPHALDDKLAALQLDSQGSQNIKKIYDNMWAREQIFAKMSFSKIKQAESQENIKLSSKTITEIFQNIKDKKIIRTGMLEDIVQFAQLQKARKEKIKTKQQTENIQQQTENIQQQTENIQQQTENIQQQTEKNDEEKIDEVREINRNKIILQKISATRDLRTSELANNNVRQAHSTYETAINTQNPQALSTLTSSLSKTQTDQDKATNPITSSDVSQMLFFWLLLKTGNAYFGG